MQSSQRILFFFYQKTMKNLLAKAQFVANRTIKSNRLTNKCNIVILL